MTQTTKVVQNQKRQAARLGDRSPWHGAINVAKVCMDIVIILVAVLEISRRLAPGPALIYNQQQPIGTEATYVAQVLFRNPTSNWPIHAIRAEWRTLTPTLSLSLDINAPASITSMPSPAMRVLETRAPLPANRSFYAVFQDRHAFELSIPTVQASVPRVGENGIWQEPIPVFDSDRYEQRQYEEQIRLAFALTAAAALVLLVHLLLGFIQRKVL